MTGRIPGILLLSKAGDALWSGSEDLDPAPRFAIAIYLGVAATIVLLLVLRRIDGVTNPQFWAEDGLVFFRQNLELGCWRALHTGIFYWRGSPYLGQKLVACAATPFPIASVPLVYNAAAYLVTAASLASFSLPSFRHVIRADALRVIFCLAVTALPQARELVGSLTNTSWYLGIWLLLLTIMRLPRSPIALVGLSCAGLLATFSAPLSILTAPLWLTRALHSLRKRRLREACFATVALCGVLVLIYCVGDIGRDRGAPPSLAQPIFNTVSMPVLADAALGPPAVRSLFSRLGSGVVYGIAVLLLVVLAALGWLTRWRNLPVLLFCTYGILASSALTLIGRPNLAPIAATLTALARPHWFPARYHVLAVSLVYLAMLASIDRLPAARDRWIATLVLLAWLVSTQVATFVLPPFYDLHWPSYAARLERKLADQSLEPLNIPINPDRFGYAFKIALDVRAIAPEVRVPRDSMLGPLLDTTTVEQSFVARCPDLSEIDLFFGKVGHPVGQSVYVQLREEQTGRVVTTHALDAPGIVSQIETELTLLAKTVETGKIAMTKELAAAFRNWAVIRALYFAPIHDSEGKRYVITVTASGGAAGDSVTLYGSASDSYLDGEARRKGDRIPGDVAFRYGCSRP